MSTRRTLKPGKHTIVFDFKYDGPGFGNVDGLQGDRVMILDPSILGSIVGNPRGASLAAAIIAVPANLAEPAVTDLAAKGCKAALLSLMARWMKIPGPERPVFVRADGRAPYQAVARVMARLSASGFTKLNLITDTAPEA